jgi:hypothetical protein
MQYHALLKAITILLLGLASQPYISIDPDVEATGHNIYWQRNWTPIRPFIVIEHS